MKRFVTAVLATLCFAIRLPAFSQSHPVPKTDEPIARLLAVAKDWAPIAGNVGGWPTASSPRVPVEFLAVVTVSGSWFDPTRMCAYDNASGCNDFLREYVNQSTDYTVITEPGWGISVHVSRVPKIGDCYGFSSEGLLSASEIGETAIASDVPGFFAVAPAWEVASPSQINIARKGLLRLGAQKIKSFDSVKVLAIRLEGNLYYVAERHSEGDQERGIVFAIGKISHGQFELLRWNPNGGEDGDTVESVLGVIRLKSGREFLITTESDPEGQRFYAYGIKDGRLQIVFQGGGSSC